MANTPTLLYKNSSWYSIITNEIDMQISENL
jgi:hypothetical protein